MNFFKNKRIIQYILIAAISIFFVCFFFRSNPRFSDAVFKISSPLVKAGNSIYLAGKSFFIIGKINRENAVLSKENAELIRKASELEEMRRENIALKNMLNIPILKDKNVLRADIAGFNPFNADDLLVVNKGKKDGIKSDLPVISEEGNLIGKVESAAEDYSKILLIFSSRSSVAVISQESRSSGIVKGSFGTSLVLDMVPQFDAISEGDLLITSGIGGIFPKGIPVGKIESINISLNEVFKKAKVKPLVDLHKLESVVVILD